MLYASCLTLECFLISLSHLYAWKHDEGWYMANASAAQISHAWSTVGGHLGVELTDLTVRSQVVSTPNRNPNPDTDPVNDRRRMRRRRR